MASADNNLVATANEFDRRARRFTLAAVVAITGMTMLAIGLMASGKPEVALMLAAAPVVVAAIAFKPDVATYVVLFLVYTNAPVVAMRYHHVPFAVSAAIPLLLLIPIGYRFFVRREPIVFPRITALILLFVVVQAVGAMLSRDPDIAIGGLIISLTEGVALFLLLVNAIRTPEALRGAVWALLAAGAFMGLVCAHQYATGSYHKNYGGFAQIQGKGFGVEQQRGRVIQHRATGPLGVENRFAQIMLMLVPLGLCRVWAERANRLRWLAVILTGLIAVGWGLAFSRGSAVALVLTLGIMTLMGCIRIRQVAPLAVAMALLLLLLPQYRTRLASLQTLPSFISGAARSSDPDGAIKGRATEMLAAARVFVDHPIVGVGPGMFRYYSREYGLAGGLRALEGTREAHCLYLAILAEHGALGFLCFMGVLGVTLRDLFRVRRDCPSTTSPVSFLVTGFILAIVVYMTTGIFAHFSFVRYFWTMMALATAAVYIGGRFTKEVSHAT